MPLPSITSSESDAKKPRTPTRMPWLSCTAPRLGPADGRTRLRHLMKM
jgi:hypothetical protein